MNKYKMTIISALLFSFVLSSFSQEPPALKQSVQTDDLYLMLKSPKISERMKAVGYFAGLSKKEIHPNLMNEFIDFFAEESNRIKEAQKKENIPFGAIPKTLFADPEDFLTYINNLCILVGRTGDLRALPLLCEYGAHPNTFVEFGEYAVVPYLEAMKKSGPSQKLFYFRVLSFWLSQKKEGYNASGAARKTIINVLIENAFYEKDDNNRFLAVSALLNANDEDLIPVFEKIAAEDPFHFEEGERMATDRPLPPEKKALRYPLREMAKKWLEKRRNK